MNIEVVKPKEKVSDKYSIQVYKFLTKNPCCLKVYYQAMHPIQVSCDENHEPVYEYKYFEFDINNFNIKDIYFSCQSQDLVSKYNEITGATLSRIISDSKNKYELYCYACGYSPRKYVDITSIFWSEYVKRGRCIWDRKHNGWLMDDDNRFTYANKNSRRCNWCGEWQHRKINKKVRIERKEIWVGEVSND
jgi:predicted nucleic-acid-binding Zn-ribbon protein